MTTSPLTESESLVELQKNIPWVESPFFETELKKASLALEIEALVRHYAENGYVIVDPDLDEATIDAAVAALAPEFAAKNVTRIQDAWRENEQVKHIATAPKVLDLLRILYRREPIPFQTLNFNVGTQQRTHSDMIHFSSIPERFMCGVWVALEDIHANNGPLHYYPGSHKLPFFDLVDMNLRGSDSKSLEETYGYYAKRYENFIEAAIQAAGLTKTTLNVKKGQALIWSANLLHGGEKIKTPGATRHSQVSHYYFEGCTYYTPLLSDVPLNRTFLRRITDIRTGQIAPNVYLGEILEQDYEGYTSRKYIPKTIQNTMRRIGDLMPRALVETLKKKLK